MTPFAPPTLFGRGTAVFREHADLRPIVARLRAHATELALDRQPAEAGFDALLATFLEQLLVHFAAEEGDDYFGTFIKDYPELAADVDRLTYEHDEMVDAIELLRVGKAHRNARETALGLLDLLDSFEEHERKESVVVRRFLLGSSTAEQSVKNPTALRVR